MLALPPLPYVGLPAAPAAPAAQPSITRPSTARPSTARPPAARPADRHPSADRVWQDEAAPDVERSERGPGHDQQSSSEERTTQNFTVGEDAVLVLQNVSGSISITGGAKREIRIEAVKRTSGSDAKRQLSTVTVDIQQSGNRVEVNTRHSRGSSRAWVDYVVSVPTGASVEVGNVSGDTVLKDIAGEVHASTVSGDLKGINLGRVAKLNAVSGNITVDKSTTTGLQISTVSGEVRIEQLTARDFQYSTVSGDLIVANCACDRVQGESVSGNLELGARFTRNGRYNLTSHSGDITLVPLSGGSGLDVKLNTFSGNLHSDFGGAPTGKRGGFMGGGDVRVKVGDGGAFVEASTFSGDVNIRKSLDDKGKGQR